MVLSDFYSNRVRRAKTNSGSSTTNTSACIYAILLDRLMVMVKLFSLNVVLVNVCEENEQPKNLWKLYIDFIPFSLFSYPIHTKTQNSLTLSVLEKLVTFRRSIQYTDDQKMREENRLFDLLFTVRNHSLLSIPILTCRSSNDKQFSITH